jgi:hypothetical protein
MQELVKQACNEAGTVHYNLREQVSRLLLWLATVAYVWLL